MKSRIAKLDALYQEMVETYDGLCSRNPKSDLLPLVSFDREVPARTRAFEIKYKKLIKGNPLCMFLEADEQYLKDLNLEIANTY